MGVSVNQNARSRAQLQIPKYELITSGGDPIHGHNFSRRLGGESYREILMAPVCVILSLGLWSSNSAPMGRGRACPWGWCK